MGSLSKCTWSVSGGNGLSSLELGGLSLSSVWDALMSGTNLDSFSGLSWGCPGWWPIDHGAHWVCVFQEQPLCNLAPSPWLAVAPRHQGNSTFLQVHSWALAHPKMHLPLFLCRDGLFFWWWEQWRPGNKLQLQNQIMVQQGENHSSPASGLLEIIGLWT